MLCWSSTTIRETVPITKAKQSLADESAIVKNSGLQVDKEMALHYIPFHNLQR